MLNIDLLVGDRSVFLLDFEVEKSYPCRRPKWPNFKLLQKLIQNSYDINFFPVKAEMLLFPNLVTGGPRGDLGSVNFDAKSYVKTEKLKFSQRI